MRSKALHVLSGPPNDCKAFIACFFDVPERVAAHFMGISLTKLKASHKKSWGLPWPFHKVRAGSEELTFDRVREHREEMMKKCSNDEIMEMLEKAKDYGAMQARVQPIRMEPQVEELQVHEEPISADELGAFPSPEEVAKMFEPLPDAEFFENLEPIFPSDEDVAKLFE